MENLPECIGKAELVKEPVCKRCGNPLGMPGRNIVVTVTGKNIFLIRERQYLSIRGQCNTRCIVFKYANRREYAAFYGKMACIQYARWISRLGIDAIIPGSAASETQEGERV